VTASQAIRANFRGTIGKFALDAGFTAPAKGVTALFGPSGCGKTTVLRCIAGLLRINGVCEIDGEVWQDENGAFLPTHKRPLGYVFQEASLFQHLSVRKNLLFGAPRDNRDGTKKGSIVFDEVVELLGITRLLDRSPRNLSGGERQRVAIGRALLSQPKLLLMDEPLSALDRVTKNEILPFLERLRDHLNLPVVYITHDIAEVERLADQMVLMDKGHVIGAGPLEELQSNPSLPLAAARDAAVSFIGIVQSSDETYGLVTLKLRGGVLTVPAPAAPVGERRRIRVIASDVSLTREAPAPSSILNVLPARVVSTKPVDSSEILVVVALGHDGAGARLLSRVTRKASEALGLAEGVNVYAQVKAVALAPGRGEVG
jgi:molybdate transport system ATP-binding protein